MAFGMTKNELREGFMFLVYWLVAHAAGDIFCGLFLSQTFGEGPDGGGGRGPLILFSLVFTLLLAVLYQKRFSQDSESKRLFLTEVRAGGVSFGRRLTRNLKNRLIAAGLDALLLVPYLIFYSIFGFHYAAAVGIERFYAMDAGLFEAVRSAFPGWLCCVALLLATLLVCDLITLRGWEKDGF